MYLKEREPEYTRMSEFTAMQDAIKKQYGFDTWSDAAAPHLAASRLAFGLLPRAQKSSNFTLERRVELPEDRPGFHAYIEYYRGTSDEETRFAVTFMSGTLHSRVTGTSKQL
jgi:hypothetical protein